MLFRSRIRKLNPDLFEERDEDAGCPTPEEIEDRKLEIRRKWAGRSDPDTPMPGVRVYGFSRRDMAYTPRSI